MALPTTDQRGRLLKDLASEVKKLRGWAASDESVAERLADALNELTAQRLLAHQFVAAAEDAQDALTRANKLVAAHGAVGPFTPVDDGVRFFIATTHLAATQSGAGQPALGGQVAGALRGWVALLPHVDLTPYVGARTATWLLMAQARAALASGDVAAGNSWSDAAVARAREGALGAGDDAPALVDVLRLAADARWIAGVGDDSVALAREASDVAAAVAAPVLGASARVAEAWVARTLAPLVAARRDLADRLLATGDVVGGLAERRGLADLLESHVGRLGTPARDALAHTLADLAHDLSTLDRDDEALDAAGRAAEVAGELAATEATAGAHLAAQFGAVTVLARVLVRRGEHEEAAEALAALFDRYGSLRRPAGFEAAVARATLVRAEVERASGDQQAAERSLREFHSLVAGLRDASPADKELHADVPADALARDRFRGVVSRSSQPVSSWPTLSDADALAAATRAPLAAPTPEEVAVEPEPVVEPEPERVAVVQPEPIEVPEPVAVEPVAVEPVAPEPVAPEPVEPEPVAVEPQPVGEPEPVTSASETRELAAAQAALQAAKATGHRRDTLTAAEAVVAELRRLAASDRAQWGRVLVTALEDLGDAKFRAGDWWGSRAPKKEAKQLAKELGL